MQTRRLDAARLPDFIAKLMDWGPVWAPVETAAGTFTLQIIEDVVEARPDVLRTVVPFKKLLLPPSFAMLKGGFGDVAGVDPVSGDNNHELCIFFGAHACDVHALKILDLLYLSNHVDPYYAAKRDKLVVVAFGCWPDEKCFCDSLGTSTVDDGFDIALTPLDGSLLVTVATSRGDDIVRAAADLFTAATPDDILAYLTRLSERRAAFQLQLDVTDLPYVLELKKHDPVWDELARKCVCCG